VAAICTALERAGVHFIEERGWEGLRVRRHGKR
jgi:hypothetical protein